MGKEIHNLKEKGEESNAQALTLIQQEAKLHWNTTYSL